MINYTYEAYGVPKITINNSLRDGKLLLARKLKDLNIFLYKGYIYDSETKLYYCETRYYDPEVGRWLSVDSFNYMDPSSPNGLNLYAYCLNNPVMYVDPSGKFAITSSLLLWAFSALVVSTIAYIEVELHPIENTFKLIEKGVEYLVNDVNWQSIGNSIEMFFTNTINSVSSWWDNIYLMGKSKGGGRDSGLVDVENDELPKMLEDAKMAGETALVMRLLREMKNRGLRNKRKKRGGPNMRGYGWLLLIPRAIRRLFRYNEY